MTIFGLKDFLKKNDKKDDTMRESGLKKFITNLFRLEILNLNQNDNHQKGGTRWTCFNIKDNN